MPPKRRGYQGHNIGKGSETSPGLVSTRDESSLSAGMNGKPSPARGKRKERPSRTQNTVPEVYRQMLVEAIPAQSGIPDRPLKRRRTSRPGTTATRSNSLSPSTKADEDEDIDAGLQFEDIPSTDNLYDQETGQLDTSPPKQQQTVYRDSEEESVASDFEWEAVDFDIRDKIDEPSGDLELNLSTKANPQSQKPVPKRRQVPKAERTLRLGTHKLHVLCLLSYLDHRNEWCNDEEVKDSLRPLIDKKMLKFLRPRADLSQFGRTDSLKRGLEQVSTMWKTKFSITARGLRKALWADDERDIRDFQLSEDSDLTVEKSDFREAAKTLKGSRDLGAQLFCALLRSVGVETRLIFSLQPLSFNAGGPGMQRSSAAPIPKPPSPDIQDEGDVINLRSPEPPSVSSSKTNADLTVIPRRRLGHPNAADYYLPNMRASTRDPPKAKRKVITESPYPVFWVEVFDEAHQKWFPVDPLVTGTIAKPRAFEPPASDHENSMSYVIAFEEEGCARDVTRRYTKAYNAKTRKSRVESTPGGEKWWRRTLRAYARGWINDADQIEDGELAAAEAREPMPKNIADFKDHPYYALERHLRRNEVLISTHEIGKVAAGRDSRVLGGKKLESVYRRKDVKVVRSADAWYRLGRDIKFGEQPVKIVPAKSRPGDEDGERDLEERAGTNLYTEGQTELYVPPPIVNGRVPKNSYGNLDVFVSTMVPKGGIHMPYDEASHAARILGIDYSDALTGFEFRGRHGTAVLKGVVVAEEYREAVEAVIEGLHDEQARVEEEIRTYAALKMWKHFMMVLRIKQRVDGYAVEGENADVEESGYDDNGEDSGMESEEYVDDGGGGFFPE